MKTREGEREARESSLATLPSSPFIFLTFFASRRFQLSERLEQVIYPYSVLVIALDEYWFNSKKRKTRFGKSLQNQL